MQKIGRQEVDDACFEVCRLVEKHFHSASKIYGEFGNIFSLFFHDLVIHFTGIVLHRNALGRYRRLESFPWVDKNYAENPIKLELNNLQRKEDVPLAKQFLKRRGLIPVAYGMSVPLVQKKSIFGDRILKTLLPSAEHDRAYLANKNDQLDVLGDLVFGISRVLGVTNQEIIWENWRRYAETFITTQQKTINGKGILVGTRNNLQNRILAINYRQQEKPVVGFTHGEITNSVFDEPVFGYSDKTLCTTLVDYGSFTPTKEKYPAIIQPDQVLRRSSPVVTSIYKRSSEIQYKELSCSRVLLIPTVYQGNCMYGPSHAYETDLYYRWHLAIADLVPDITIKLHPKTRIKKKFSCKCDYRQLEECVDEYDILLFDFFSTAGVLAIFSDKPVIYFNIGLRRLNPVFEDAVRRRCTVIDIDFEDEWKPQIKAGFAGYSGQNHTVSNLDLNEYSMVKEPDYGLWSTILDIMRSTPEN